MIKIVIKKIYFSIQRIKIQIHNFAQNNISIVANNYLEIYNYTIQGMILKLVKKTPRATYSY